MNRIFPIAIAAIFLLMLGVTFLLKLPKGFDDGLFENAEAGH